MRLVQLSVQCCWLSVSSECILQEGTLLSLIGVNILIGVSGSIGTDDLIGLIGLIGVGEI